MIDDVKSFIDAAHILKERGAYKIYVLATHGILSADAPRLIEESPIDEVSDLSRLTRGPRLLSYFSLVFLNNSFLFYFSGGSNQYSSP